MVIITFELKKNEIFYKKKGDWVNSVNFSFNSKLIAFGCKDNTIKVWPIEFKNDL